PSASSAERHALTLAERAIAVDEGHRCTGRRRHILVALDDGGRGRGLLASFDLSLAHAVRAARLAGGGVSRTAVATQHAARGAVPHTDAIHHRVAEGDVTAREVRAERLCGRILRAEAVLASEARLVAPTGRRAVGDARRRAAAVVRADLARTASTAEG